MAEFKCPNCGAALTAPDSRAGQTMTCPACDSVAGVPVRLSGTSPPEAQEPIPAASPAEDEAPEKLLYRGQPSHWVHLAHYIAGTFFVAAGAVLIAPANVRESVGYVGGMVVLLLGLAIVACAYLDRAATRFEITTRTVSLKRGILWHRFAEIPTRSVYAIRLHQDPIERLVKVGKLEFWSDSILAGRIAYRGVRDPDSLRMLVREYSEA